jgi:prepilin-type processing-associated H-X9-DG protein
MIAFGDEFEEADGRIYEGIQGRFGLNFRRPPETEETDQRVEAARRRHSSRCSVGFCDGHVEGTAFRELFAWQDDTLRRWNVDNEPHSGERQISE